MYPNSLSKLSNALVNIFEEKKIENNDKKISVNPLLSKITSWYEKLRTSMDYGEEETVFRKAIERILKRRLMLDQQPQYMADGLVRELIWAKYFQDGTVPETIINDVAKSIDLHLRIKNKVSKEKGLNEGKLNEFFIQVLSCDIDSILLPRKEKEAMINYMFRIVKDSIAITDMDEQTKDAQVYLAVRKNFAKDDIASLRYHLFIQLFGRLSERNFDNTLKNFKEGYKEIEKELVYPRKDRVFNHIKKETPPFLILYDILIDEKGNIRNLVRDETAFRKRVFFACDRRYKGIRQKVRTAIIRSFIFILFTKAFIALFIEGTFENLVFGHIQWASIGINTLVPPLLMIIVGLSIKTPGTSNSERIFTNIKKILFLDEPNIAPKITIKTKSGTRTIREYIFSFLWLTASVISFGVIVFVLTRLHFNILSQGIFLFFVAIISFLAYRIFQTANTYTLPTKQGILTPVINFFFVPIVTVGRSLTEGVSQINFILIIVDFIIETPFKGLVGFFEQWFVFLAVKREELE